MDAIDIMVSEHDQIKRVLHVVRKMCIHIMNGKNVDIEAFYHVIDFVRNYADKHHHSKEENILFKKMSSDLGERVANGPIYGMYAEHDLGRLFIMNLENALEKFQQGDREAKVDIIANAIAYTDLLWRHIDKEDTAIYTFAKKSLSPEALEEINQKCEEVERTAAKDQVQKKYTDLVQGLEERIKHV